MNEWFTEKAQQFADGFSLESRGEEVLPESVKTWQVAKPTVDAHELAHPLQSAAIRIERVSSGLWRVYSEFDGEFVDITTQGMKALLDELLKIAGQFADSNEDETPQDWQPRER